MAVRDIVLDGNKVLRTRCKEVTTFDSKLGKLLDDMKETMYKADGVGLAAPQVGILKRVVVVGVEDFFIEMVNPKILKQKGKQIGPEGCLSVPNKSCEVLRPQKVKIEYQDRKGDSYIIEAEDFIARAFCHELDHLDGILYYDKEYKKDSE